MAVTPSPEIPPAGKVTATSQRPYSGTNTPTDPTTEPNQYPPDASHGIFGGPLPTGTGAPGTAPARGGVTDPSNEPGQTSGDGFSGTNETQVTQTGAPGTQGAVGEFSGGESITYTYPNDGIGPYQQVSYSDELSGPGDSTQANDSGYATNGPQLPGVQGNQPQAGSSRFQPGGGRVLRGGRAVRG